MGLLKRAASLCFILQQTVDHSDQNQKKLLSEQLSEIITSQGLLKKTISLVKSGFVYTQRSLFWPLKKQKPQPASPLAEEYRAKIDQFDDDAQDNIKGIAYVYSLFEKIKKLLNLYDAALFMFNRLKNCYMPWALSGLAVKNPDQLMLTEPSPEISEKLASGVPYIAEVDSPLFFSTMDRSLAPLLVAPFIHAEKLVALLIIFNADKNIYDLQALTALLNGICRIAAPRLFKQRETKLSTLTYLDPLKWENRKSSILSLYQECKSENVALFLMITSLKNTLKTIKAKNEYITSQCFFADILLLINSLLSGIGLAYRIHDEKITIFFKGYNTLDPRLLLHQIFTQIKELYGVLAQDWRINLPEKPDVLLEEEKNIDNILKEYLNT
ncbi:MAG: hypothetical protein JW822_11520 [Spirochaetales bacterium]|nr:hypothetical protein [Spirochaetales bacterium]